MDAKGVDSNSAPAAATPDFLMNSRLSILQLFLFPPVGHRAAFVLLEAAIALYGYLI